MPYQPGYRLVRFQIPLLAPVTRRGVDLHLSPVTCPVPGTPDVSSRLCSRSGPFDPSGSTLVPVYARKLASTFRPVPFAPRWAEL